jgi:hypothetical protein
LLFIAIKMEVNESERQAITRRRIIEIGGETQNFAALEYLPDCGLYVVLANTYHWGTFRALEGMPEGIWDEALVYLFAALMAAGGPKCRNVAFTNFTETWNQDYGDGEPSIAEVNASVGPFRRRLSEVRPKAILNATGVMHDKLPRNHVNAAAADFGLRDNCVVSCHPSAVPNCLKDARDKGRRPTKKEYENRAERFKQLLDACSKAFSFL